MLQEENKATSSLEGITLESIEEIVKLAKIWYQEINSLIKTKMLKPDKVPEAVFKWYTKML